MEPSINQRLVSSLVEKMLLHSGYMIYKVDYEKVLQELVEKNKIDDYKPYLKDIKKHEYDFMLIANRRPYMIQIKFCKKIKPGDEEVILVTPEEPVFQIQLCKKIKPLSEFLDIEEGLLKKYKQIIKRKFR